MVQHQAGWSDEHEKAICHSGTLANVYVTNLDSVHCLQPFPNFQTLAIDDGFIREDEGF